MKKFIIFFIVILIFPVLVFSQTLRDSTKTPITLFNSFREQINISTPSLQTQIDGVADSTGTVPKPVTIVAGFTKDCDYKVGDYGTANECIQAALDYLNTLSPKGGKISFREGVYSLIDTQINIPCENIMMQGQGKATRFQIVVDAPSVDQFKVNNHAGCKISDIYFDGSGAERAHIIRFIGTGIEVGAEVSNCYFKVAGGVAVYIFKYNKTRFVNNIIEMDDGTSIVGEGLKLNNSFDSVFEGNTIEFTGTSTDRIGINFDYSVKNSVIDTNTLKKCGLELDRSSYCVVSDNIVEGATYGIRILSGADGAGESTITGNTVVRCGNGIRADGTNDIVNVIISNNRVLCPGTTGLLLLSIAKQFQVDGNDFKGCGIDISDSGTNTRIRNNIDKNGDWLPENDVAGFTTYYFQLGGFISDIYESTSVPVDMVAVPSSWTITGLQAFSLFSSTCASVIFEVMTATGTNTIGPIVWTSISTIELSTGTTKSEWTVTSTDADMDKFVGLFVNFVSEVGGDLNLGAGVTVKYHRKE